MKDAQELLRKVDSDLNQKYSPDFKDRYQIELLLRELDVSDGPMSDSRCLLPDLSPEPAPHSSPLLPGPHPPGEAA